MEKSRDGIISCKANGASWWTEYYQMILMIVVPWYKDM